MSIALNQIYFRKVESRDQHLHLQLRGVVVRGDAVLRRVDQVSAEEESVGHPRGTWQRTRSSEIG